MDPFWGITLSVLVLSKFFKSEKKRRLIKQDEKEIHQEKVQREFERLERESNKPVPLTEAEKEAERVAKEAEKQRQRDIAELRKQGFTDELIATIIPTINNGR